MLKSVSNKNVAFMTNIFQKAIKRATPSAPLRTISTAVQKQNVTTRRTTNLKNAILGRPLGAKTFSTSKLPDVPTPPFPNEPQAPSVKTPVPGPKSNEMLQQLSKFQDNRSQHLFVDYSQSRGNYIVDADGNVLLDVLCSIASHSVGIVEVYVSNYLNSYIGYNNPALIAAAKSDEWTTALINRPATGVQPSTIWPSLLEKSVMQVAPKGLDNVFTVMCGSCAVETSYKAVFMAHQHKMRGGRPFTEEELTSCAKNQPPGSPDLAILSFQNGFHGRLFGSLSTTRTKPLHKLDIPAFDWPAAPFPQLSYPLHENEAKNKQEEERCLQETEKIIKNSKKKIVGMIVEPIQGEGGDNHASPEFFRGLQKIAKENDVYFMVDEVQTGVGATGKFWAHEHWNLPSPPDVVTFSKKMQAAGFYHSLNLRAPQTYRNFNTWLGDPVRLMQASVIINEIKEKELLKTVNITGEFLKNSLHDLEKKDSRISRVRGVGTLIAFDLPTPELQTKLLHTLRQKGVEATGSGTKSIRMRPMLIFAPRHAAQFLDILSDSLKTL